VELCRDSLTREFGAALESSARYGLYVDGCRRLEVGRVAQISTRRGRLDAWWFAIAREEDGSE